MGASIGAAILLAGWTLPAAAPAAALVLPADSAGDAGQLRRGWKKMLGPGVLLVAARNLPDPNFAETVVLLAEYSDDGAMGVIVNRETGVPLRRIFPGVMSGDGAAVSVYFGGPVQVSGALALLRSGTPPSGARKILPDVSLISTRALLEETIAAGAEPSRLRVYLGYAGWGPGQLDGEIARLAWHVAPGLADPVFDPDPDSVWEREIRRSEALMASAAAPPRALESGRP